MPWLPNCWSWGVGRTETAQRREGFNAISYAAWLERQLRKSLKLLKYYLGLTGKFYYLKISGSLSYFKAAVASL